MDGYGWLSIFEPLASLEIERECSYACPVLLLGTVSKRSVISTLIDPTTRICSSIIAVAGREVFQARWFGSPSTLVSLNTAAYLLVCCTGTASPHRTRKLMHQMLL